MHGPLAAAAASRSEPWDFFFKAATMRRHDGGLKFRTPTGRFTASVPLASVLCHYSSVARFPETVLGGSISCLVALMVLDFGRVINLS